jgi:hypothetical protein
MDFLDWLETKGCQVTIIQPDDDGGYVVAEVITPLGVRAEVSVMLT